MGFKAVFFDLGGTLFRYTDVRGHFDAMLRELSERHRLEVIPEAGTVIARDGKRAVTTPYDDCVLVMPSLRLKPGQTAVRLGREVP